MCIIRMVSVAYKNRVNDDCSVTCRGIGDMALLGVRRLLVGVRGGVRDGSGGVRPPSARVGTAAP